MAPDVEPSLSDKSTGTADRTVQPAVVPRRSAEHRLQILWEAAAVLLTTDEPDAMLRRLFDRIGPHLQLDTYFNYMVNETGDALRLASCVGVPPKTIEAITRLEFGQAICGLVAIRREPITATYIQESDDPKAQLVKSFGIRAYACNPLIADGKLLGTLSFASRSRDEFDPDELEFLRTICHYVTAAYERLHLISQLREADRRKDEFLATLAHELRNPLAPIRNGLEVMRLASDDPQIVADARGMMERQIGHMVHLIDDLLDVSRISRGKISLRRERVDLADIVQHAIETSRPLIQASGHELILELAADPVVVDGDPARLTQVLSNLLTNAAKFTQSGGVIHLRVERQGSDAVIQVRDTGVGIPAGMLTKIFEIFAQVGRTIDSSHGGLGIGLSLVKGLVELHGGSVTARSEGLGQGSEFTIRLPSVLPVLDSTTGVLTEGPALRRPRRRILVVDDNKDAARSLAMLLRLRGHEVQVAHDGIEALNAAETFRPETVFLDIGMPRLNGYETARKLREQEWGRAIVLIALTGWGQDGDRQQARDAGFDLHLVKPIKPADLDALVGGIGNDSVAAME